MSVLSSVRQRLVFWFSGLCLDRCAGRPADFIIGGSESPYLLRWFVIPRNRFLNVYLHRFLRSDDDRALHDHPWLFNASIIVQGEYTEQTIAAGGIHARRLYTAGAVKFRWGRAPHRVELTDGQACTTIFITGPRIRSWGFHCPEQGWIHWKRFTDPTDSGKVGAGCDS